MFHVCKILLLWKGGSPYPWFIRALLLGQGLDGIDRMVNVKGVGDLPPPPPEQWSTPLEEFQNGVGCRFWTINS